MRIPPARFNSGSARSEIRLGNLRGPEFVIHLGAIIHPVTAVWINRIILVLSFAGIFVAGVLSLGHILERPLPCGIYGGGCDAVALDPSSKWFNIPVAVYGLVAYLTVTGLTILRLTGSGESWKALTRAGFVLTLGGALVSFYLQYHSLAVIKSLCPWCMASAITMTLLFLFHAVLWQSGPPKDARGSAIDFGVLGISAVLALGFLGWEAVKLTRSEKLTVDISVLGDNSYEQLVPEDAHVHGSKDAPITIVEFADFTCGQCMKLYPVIKDLVRRSNGKIKHVYRHFPLFESHPAALTSAILSEYAGEHGFFWQFAEQSSMLQQDQTKQTDVYFALIRNFGLDAEKARQILRDPESGAFSRVYRDRALADKLGLISTPVIIILADGLKARTVSSADLINTLSAPEYQAILKGDVP